MTTSTAIGSGATTTTEAAATTTVPADHPGRWVGGVIGALVSLAAAVISGVVTDTPAMLGWDSWSAIGLLGMPIGVILGRELLPMARGEGWNRAIGTGLLFGWVAPPLGAIEVLGGSRLLDLGNMSSSVVGPIALFLLPVALPISFVAIFITIPVGLAWGVLVRLVPDEAFAALRVPAPFGRLGVRHALAIVVVGLLALELAARS